MTAQIQQRIQTVGPTTDDAVLIAVERRGWALLAVASLFALGFFGFDTAGGAVLGGAVGLLNFRLIKVYFGRVLRRGRRPAMWMHVAYMAKYAALLGLPSLRPLLHALVRAGTCHRPCRRHGR